MIEYTLASEVQIESGVVCPPWETTPNGVVSLLDMLEFSARDYVQIAHRFGFVLATLRKSQPNQPILDLGNEFRKLTEEVNRLGLLVTREAIGQFLLEVTKEHPNSVAMAGEGDERIFYFKDVGLNNERTCHHLETIYSTLTAELRTVLFKVIPQERVKFCDPKWLTTSPIFAKFPDTVDEFQKAGRCFAYGENTACVFHLMRVTDFYLRKVAESIPGVTYDARSWDGLGKLIVKKMEEKYQTKTDEWKSKEPFFAEILTDIQAISRGHRNPALHELEKKYDEREAAYMLTVIEGFARHVADKL